MANFPRAITIIIFFFFTCFTTTAIRQTDLHALLEIKRSMIEDPKNALSSWNETSKDFCTWKGVSCGRKHSNRVVGIYLHSQGLVGQLSPYIGNLSFLRTIDLQNNTFTGIIPEEIGYLRRLEYLEVSNNSFVGQIPKNLSQCSNIVYLNLIDNKLSGHVPQELGVLRKLEFLGLTYNSIQGSIPPFIGNLTSLTVLSMGSCNLIGEIPESLSQLKSLTFIQLGLNNLTGEIPPGLFNISTITVFQMHVNQLQGGIPANIGVTLPNLKHLFLYRNNFTGEVPTSFPNASSLERIELGDNNFVGSMPKEMGWLSVLLYFNIVNNHIRDDVKFISSFANCTKLKELGVGMNHLSGSLPESIGNLSKSISNLWIGFTDIEGKIPFGIGRLTGLTSLDLGRNNLEGPIPSSIGNLVNLNEMYLDRNKFETEIPSSFGMLRSLNVWTLSMNSFHGSIPHELGNCTSLLELDLSYNNLNSTIPREIMPQTLSPMILFDISHNALSGSIPAEVQILTNLEQLDLSHNNLSGAIPNSVGSCKSLQLLYLEGNSFVGEIPTGLSELKGLVALDLSQNKLTGKIPSFLGQLQLQYLNLSYNDLRGEVPTEGVFTNNSAVSLDGNQDICGGIPDLQLPPCPVTISKSKNAPNLIKILIPVAIGGFIFIFVSSFLIWFTYKRKMSGKETAFPSFDGVQVLRISYSDLLKATQGFSQANLLGVGTFGSVYKGTLEDGHALIAVKVLKLTVRGASKSFLAEINALKSIRHRNLLKILSACESIDFQGNDFKALIFEFKANGSLEKWVHTDQERETTTERVTKLNLVQKLNIAIDVANGIEYLHYGTDETIVHGDLKPSNILLDDDMNAFVADFGLAKIISSTFPTHHQSSSSAAIKGTVGYVAPEYGTTDRISTQGDVYSYGILLLELFTNTRPTDDMFRDHFNLHAFVSSALPDGAMEIVETDDGIIGRDNMREVRHDKVGEFVSSVLSIGVACSREDPRDRMSMTEVVSELSKISDKFIVGARNYSNFR